jgi:hypothetical protein
VLQYFFLPLFRDLNTAVILDLSGRAWKRGLLRSSLTHESSPLAWLHALLSCFVCLPACGLFDLSIQGIGKAMVRIAAAPVNLVAG